MKNEKLNTELITNYMKDNSLNEKQFCEICNVPLKVLSQMFAQDYDFDIRYLVRVCKLLKVELKDMFCEI